MLRIGLADLRSRPNSGLRVFAHRGAPLVLDFLLGLAFSTSRRHCMRPLLAGVTGAAIGLGPPDQPLIIWAQSAFVKHRLYEDPT